MEWYAKDLNNIANQGIIIEEETGRSVAVAYDKKDMYLISAAPELLEACKEMFESSRYIKQGTSHSPIKYALAKMNDAIAKAEGK